jgi:hypothetical protein
MSFLTSFVVRIQMKTQNLFVAISAFLLITSCNKTNFAEEKREWVGLWVNGYNHDSLDYWASFLSLKMGRQLGTMKI